MIIITGVNGFIGKCLFNYYKFIRKQKVIGFDKEFEINFYKENEEDLYFFDFVKDDKSDFIQLIEDLKISKEICFLHYASEVGVSNHQESTIKSQLILSSNIYEILLGLKTLDYKIDFVYASSSEVYGSVNDEDDIKEDQNILSLSKLSVFKKPERNEYILQKAFSEILFKNLNLKSCIIFRYFNVFGPGQNKNKGINAKLVNSILNPKDEVFKINGTAIRTYTPINQAIIETFEKIESNKNLKFSIHNIVGKYTLNNYTLMNCHLIVAGFIYSLKVKEYSPLIMTLFLKELEDNKISSESLLEFNYTLIENEGEIKNRKVYKPLTFNYPYLQIEKEFLGELLVYYFIELDKTSGEIINDDFKLKLIGELFADDEVVLNYLIDVTDNPRFEKILKEIPLKGFTKDKVLKAVETFKI